MRGFLLTVFFVGLEIQELYSIFLKHPVVSTDTRDIAENSLFFALKGENFNGNKFAAEALSKGASFAIVDETESTQDDRFILVNDVLKSLQELAAYHLQQRKLPVLAITGTNGKTTTKELVNAVLSKKYNVHATRGNLNNHIGVPLTILAMTNSTDMLVIEMGANHVGEIEKLCSIAQPSFGLITNIGKAHLEGFGSLEGVIKAKKELYEYVSGNEGVLFVNGSDDLLLNLSDGAQRVLYGNADSNEYVFNLEESNPYITVKWRKKNEGSGSEHVVLSRILGAYNFENIAAAICIGNHFDISPSDIATAIEEYLPNNNRSQIMETDTNRIVLDAYNANPTNMKAAIDSFSQMTGITKVLILGDMLELGKYSEEEHEIIGELIHKQDFAKVFLVGENFGKLKGSGAFTHFDNVELAREFFDDTPLTHSLILIKASRSIGLEILVDVL